MDTNNKGPRILLVENDKRVRESYEVLLRHWGYQPILAEGEGKSLIRDANSKARKLHCILALIDLRLLDDFDEEDISGLLLAEEIHPTRSIILTGFPTQNLLLGMLENHKDIPFLLKSSAPDKIKLTLDTEVGKVCAIQRGLQIEPPDLMDQLKKTSFGSLINKYPDQVPDILAQLLPGATRLNVERLDSSLFSQHSSSGVPRPRSIILRVSEEEYEPVVVKMARPEKIKKEFERFEKFVSRKIGGNFMAKLERHVELWDIGGALYSYIGDFDVVTFSRYYQDHPIEDIHECLDSFFTVCWGKHYERRQTIENISLFDLYNDVWGDWYNKSVRDFASGPLWQDEKLTKLPGLPDPIDWFKSSIAECQDHDYCLVETTQKAVTHGDLHGDNLLVDSRKNTWVIDFERTGEGHALQDFIELEADIINRLDAFSDDPLSFYQLCIVVARQADIKELEENELRSTDPRIEKALKTISVLRSLAFKCTGIQDARQYLLGLLFNAIFRATINNSVRYRKHQQQALMLAAIFCHRLEHWNEPWPPEEWKPILNS
jgi:CheY-like chemotaxis protein